jgi:hypothetical protein
MPQGKAATFIALGFILTHFLLPLPLGRQARKEEGFDWSCQDETSLQVSCYNSYRLNEALNFLLLYL